MAEPQPSARDLDLLRQAIELAEKSPKQRTFAVGAVIADADGQVLATGYSRETDDHVHAEESALLKLDPADPRLAEATIYSSLEPCSQRASRPKPCAQLILEAGIPRVVFAWREPAIFVDCEGAEQLRAARREVIEVPELAELVRRTNAFLLG